MTLNELYSLYQYLSKQLENTAYMVYETGVLDLYEKVLHGKASRKNFLIFAIKDMLAFVRENNIEGVKSTSMVRFNRLYGK